MRGERATYEDLQGPVVVASKSTVSGASSCGAESSCVVIAGLPVAAAGTIDMDDGDEEDDNEDDDECNNDDSFDYDVDRMERRKVKGRSVGSAGRRKNLGCSKWSRFQFRF